MTTFHSGSRQTTRQRRTCQRTKRTKARTMVTTVKLATAHPIPQQPPVSTPPALQIRHKVGVPSLILNWALFPFFQFCPLSTTYTFSLVKPTMYVSKYNWGIRNKSIPYPLIYIYMCVYISAVYTPFLHMDLNQSRNDNFKGNPLYLNRCLLV